MGKLRKRLAALRARRAELETRESRAWFESFESIDREIRLLELRILREKAARKGKAA